MLLRQIEHFRAVIEEKSFTEAAVKCHISQSAISQSIKSLEDELGVKLLTRKNRSFDVTEAGEYFYKKSLVILSDLDTLKKETKKIDKKDVAELSLGLLVSYDGDEFNRAMAAFSEKYPEVSISVISGNHEDLYEALVSGKIDIALNDQRRAFSDAYENLILEENYCFVEIATHNPLSKLDKIDIEDLKNTPCILIANKKQQEEERKYYRDIVGFKSDFLFAENLQEARMMVVSNKGIFPVEGTGTGSFFGATLKRLPLTRGGNQIKRRYCAFWQKENSGFYVEEFADILKSMFGMCK